MMKYLSLFILMICMSLTWSLAHQPSSISEDAHIGIQEDLQNTITEYIKQELPNHKNLRFERMWTEELPKQQIKASFIYSFEDNKQETGSTQVMIDGYALLQKIESEDEGVDYWQFNQLSILNNHIEFKEALTIKASQ